MTGKRLPRWIRPALMGGSALLAGLVYLNVLGNPFVYDDRVTVVQNPSLRDLSNLGNVLLFMRFRPLVNLLYALEYRLWELNVVGFHLTSVLLHMGNVALLFAVVERLLADRFRDGEPAARHAPMAAAVAALFAVHPMLTEAVGYVSGRSEVLCATFTLGAFLCVRPALQGRGRLWLLPGVVLWLCAMASKEVGVVLPAVLLLYDRLLLVPAEDDAIGRRWWWHGPALGLVALAALARVWMYLGHEASLGSRSIWTNLLTQITVLWRYVGLLLFPVSQSLVHPVDEVTRVVHGGLLVALAALAITLWGLIRARRQAPLVVFGVGWFLLHLAPSAAFPLTEPMAEHRVYLAAAGLLIALATVGFHLRRRLRGWMARPLPAVVVTLTVIGVLGVATVMRNAVWASPSRLWQDAAAKAPDVYAPQYEAGNALRERGRCEAALPYYRRAVELQPEQADAWNNLGICLARLKQLHRAREVWEQLARRSPRYAPVHNNLGLLALRMERWTEAVAHFQRVLALDPKNALARQKLEELRQRSSQR